MTNKAFWRENQQCHHLLKKLKNVITKYIYNKFLSSWYDETNVEPIIEQF